MERLEALFLPLTPTVNVESVKVADCCILSSVLPLKVYVALNLTTSVLVGIALVALTEPLSEANTAFAVCIVPPLVETSSIPEPATEPTPTEPILSSTNVLDAAYIGLNNPRTEALT